LLHQRANLDIFLGHDPCEHPVAVQLGGFDPKDVGGASGVCGLFGACFKFIYILISMIKIIIMIDFFHLICRHTRTHVCTYTEAAAICEQYGGFNEINLNVGCPR